MISTSAYVNCHNLRAEGVPKAGMLPDIDLTDDDTCFPHEDIHSYGKIRKITKCKSIQMLSG